MAETPQTEVWYITFGIGTRHGKQYTEVVVDTVEQAEGYDSVALRYREVGETISIEERADRVRAAAVESYGTAWADIYDRPPTFLQRSLGGESGQYTLRERIGARRPDGSLVPVAEEYAP